MLTILDPWDGVAALCDWLNQVGDSELRNAQSQVKEALLILRRMNSEPPPPTRLGRWKQGWSWVCPREWRTLERTFAQVPLRLALISDRQMRVMVSTAVMGTTELARGLDILATASRAHLLDRVRECKRCGKWFVAKRSKKIFCSSECQQESWSEYRKTPEGLEGQRDNMRQWRAQQKRSKGRKSP